MAEQKDVELVIREEGDCQGEEGQEEVRQIYLLVNVRCKVYLENLNRCTAKFFFNATG